MLTSAVRPICPAPPRAGRACSQRRRVQRGRCPGFAGRRAARSERMFGTTEATACLTWGKLAPHQKPCPAPAAPSNSGHGDERSEPLKGEVDPGFRTGGASRSGVMVSAAARRRPTRTVPMAKPCHATSVSASLRQTSRLPQGRGAVSAPVTPLRRALLHAGQQFRASY